MNAKTIDALKAIRDSIDAIIESESAQVNTTPTETEVCESTPVKKTRGRTASRKASTTDSSDSGSSYTQEQLDSMTYNDLKSLAKSLGIVARGSRDDLTQKILDLGDSSSTEEEPAEEKTTAKAPSKTRSTRKLGAKKADPEPEEEEEEEDPVYTSVLAAVEDMSDEEIIEYLHSVGIKAKGKRQSLIAAVVKGVKDGKIELDDSDDSESEESDEDAEVDSAVDVEDTAERKKAVAKSDKDIDKQFSKGDISREDLIEWYTEAFDTDAKKVKKLTDEQLLNAYKEAAALFIDDDGELHDSEDPYTIKGTPYCCGVPLQYNEDDNTYICECCGNEYNADEE